MNEGDATQSIGHREQDGVSEAAIEHPRLLRAVDKRRDHVRGGGAARGRATVLIYGDYLCPYCRRLRLVIDRLRKSLGERLVYVYRHYPNERVHPGAVFASLAAEAAGRQGKFWEMHDALFGHDPPLDEAVVRQLAQGIGLDMKRFERDVTDPKLRHHVEQDIVDGRKNGVTATPTIFVDGVRYDGAWDFYSMLEALERPVGARVQRTARAFANLPASAGLALLIAAAAALICANSPLAAIYQGFVDAQLGVGPRGGGLWMSVADWCSEGLLAIFFLIIGLEIRREMTGGSLSDPRAAARRCWPRWAAFWRRRRSIWRSIPGPPRPAGRRRPTPASPSRSACWRCSGPGSRPG